MKKIALTLFICLTFSFVFSQETEDMSTKTITTYYLIRHSEKNISNPADRNPNLSEDGLKRSENWRNMFKNISFDAVYSTDYSRTKQTTQPIAQSKGLETIIYDLNTFDFDKFKSETSGKTILIVGHSNTTPMFVNTFIGKQKYEQIDEHNYSNLYIITIIGGTTSDTLLQIN